MDTNYAKKALRILQKEGPVALAKSSKAFIFSKKHKFQIRTIKNHVDRIKYYAPAKPNKLIWVRPEQINYANSSICKECGLGQIKPGDWDRNKSPYRKNNWRYKGLRQRYVDGYEWEDTLYIEKYEEKLESTGSASGCDTIEEFLDVRCSYLDELYEEFEENGYSLNRHKKVDKKTRTQWKDTFEPFASIARNGEIHLNEGNHRRALAEFAGVKKIPLNVLVRHKQWQELRDEVYNNGLPEAREGINDHPDFNDIPN